MKLKYKVDQNILFNSQQLEYKISAIQIKTAHFSCYIVSFNVHTHAEEIEIREQENHLKDQLIHCQYLSKLISTVGTKRK